MEQGQKF